MVEMKLKKMEEIKQSRTGKKPVGIKFAVAAVQVVTEKKDGFQVEGRAIEGSSLTAPAVDRLAVYSRSGHLCTSQTSGSLGVMAEKILERFAYDPRKITHPVYGAAISWHGEFYVVLEGAVAQASHYTGELEDLGALFHGGRSKLKDRRFGLKLFWCSFPGDDPCLKNRLDLTWSDRLRMCQSAFGLASTVRIFVDVQKGLFDFVSMEEFFCSGGEGFVFTRNSGKFYKDKPVRPLDMLLVGVGMGDVAYTPEGVGASSKTASVPVKYFYAVLDPILDAYVVILVEDLTYMFDENRSKQGKSRLNVERLVKPETVPGLVSISSLKYESAGYFGDAFNARLRAIGVAPFVPYRLIEPKRLELEDGRVLCVGGNRTFDFKGKLCIPKTPTRVVVGYNSIWMTGSDAAGNGSVMGSGVAGVHLQAGRLVAAVGFGPVIFRDLLDSNPNPVSAACLVDLATRSSRDLNIHAQKVYGVDAPSLIYGDAFNSGSESVDGYETGDSGSVRRF